MDFRKSIIAPHDRRLEHGTTSKLSMTGWLSGGWGGMSTWFRVLGPGTASTASPRLGLWFLGFRRWQPIPVLVTTCSPARYPQPQRGKVVRI
jgi:hypothetical protein